MDRNSGSHYTLPHILTVNDLLRVSPRIPLYCLMHCHTQSNYTLSGNRLWHPANMRRRSMALVLSVTLQDTNSEKLCRVKDCRPCTLPRVSQTIGFGVAIGLDGNLQYGKDGSRWLNLWQNSRDKSSEYLRREFHAEITISSSQKKLPDDV